MNEIIIITLIFFISAFTQGMVGFGSALVAIPLLLFIMPVSMASPMVVANGIVLNAYIIIKLRSSFDLRKIIPLISGTVIGIPLGVFLLSSLNEKIVLGILAIFMISFSLYSLFGTPEKIRLSKSWGYFFGLIAGALGGAYGTTGPPVVLYSSMKGWKKNEMVITLQVFFILSSIYILSLKSINGQVSIHFFKNWVKYVPVLLSGVIIGSLIYNKINQDLFKKIIYCALIILAVALLIN
jgi:uncharacterized membrane protein YfcA